MVKNCKMNGKNIQNASSKLLLEVLEQVFCIVDAEEFLVYPLLDSAYPLQIWYLCVKLFGATLN